MTDFSTGHAPHVSLQQIDELLCLRVQHPRASALIALQGAQVLEFTPTGSKPVIWLSETAAFRRGQSVRGGIPVCWPWFGDLTRNPPAVRDTLAQTEPAPAHGWVRSQPWLLQKISDTADNVSIRLEFPTSALPITWAGQVSLSLEITIGTRLELRLTTTNHSSGTLTLSQALHTYFAVQHTSQVSVQGLENVDYLDTLDGWSRKQDSAALAIAGETDRIYLDTPARLRIVDHGWQRALCIESRHSRSAVVWNPWIDKSKRLSQFEPDAYQRMLCIETARVMADCVVLPAGASDVLDVAVEVGGI